MHAHRMCVPYHTVVRTRDMVPVFPNLFPIHGGLCAIGNQAVRATAFPPAGLPSITSVGAPLSAAIPSSWEHLMNHRRRTSSRVQRTSSRRAAAKHSAELLGGGVAGALRGATGAASNNTNRGSRAAFSVSEFEHAPKTIGVP